MPDIHQLDRWRRTPPKRDGLWATRERGHGGAYLVLIVDGYVASDAELAAALGQTITEDFNYFEGESVAEITETYNTEWYFVGNQWRELYGRVRAC